MTKPRRIERVSDLAGDEIVRAADGHVWHVGHMAWHTPEGCHRMGRMVDPVTLRELKHEPVWLHPRMGVVAVVREPRTRGDGAPSVDPVAGQEG